MTATVDACICNIRRASKPILQHEFKLGGSPVLYREIPWPICSSCGQEMDFLAQVPLQQPLHISDRYSMAYVFMCPGQFDERGWLTCETWDPFSGANKVIIQESIHDTVLLSRQSEYPDYSATLEHVLEPLIDTSDNELSNELVASVHEATKLGGVPAWLQGNKTPLCPTCHGPTKLVAQFNAALDGNLPADPAEWVSDAFKFFHFGGDDGIGYLFICQDECSPDSGAFLWQCT